MCIPDIEVFTLNRDCTVYCLLLRLGYIFYINIAICEGYKFKNKRTGYIMMLQESSFSFNQKMAADDLYSLESNLSNKSMRELTDGTGKDPVTKLRMLCLSRGGTGILRLGRAFRNMDDDDSKVINKEEFTEGIKYFGLDLNDNDIEEMFNAFDEEGNGFVSLNELLLKLRPPMSERRLGQVDQAFNKMDKEGHGYISVAEFKKVYSVKEHPKYQSGEMSQDEIFSQFLNHFEGGRGNLDGSITKEEFLNYYAALSASIDDDSFFDLSMRCAYRL